jgi:hypothetical protein
MFESPLLTKMIAQRFQKIIGRILKTRFGSVPRDVTRQLGEILDEEKLSDLAVLAAQCSDMEGFREALLD